MKLDYVIYGNSNHTGMGTHCRGMVKALQKAGKRIAFEPVQDLRYQFVDEYIRTAFSNRQESYTEPAIMIYHAGREFKGSPRMGFAIFETDKIKQSDIDYYNNLDIVLVPGAWGRNVLAQNGVPYEKIKIVHEGYDPEMTGVSERAEYILARAKRRGYYTFLHVGKWEKRKSTAMICEAFLEACGKSKVPAVLKLKCGNPFNPDWYTEFIKAKWRDNGNIMIIKNDLMEKEMRQVYRDADFGLYASRGEAWNLPLQESIMFGLPSITTSWTGQGEYLQNYPEELLIKKGEPEIAEDGIFFKGDVGDWIKPDFNELVDKIRYVLQNAERVLSETRAKCVESVKCSTWSNAIRGL